MKKSFFILISLFFIAPIAAVAADIPADIQTKMDAAKDKYNTSIEKSASENNVTSIKDVQNAKKDAAKNISNAESAVQDTVNGKSENDDKPNSNSANNSENTSAAAQQLSPEQKANEQKRIADLEANAKAMKDKENSTANKTLSAASMGATGLGLSKTMASQAEQDADKAAEADMAAYLATFRCDYGDGGNQVKGGTKNVTLPGGNTLLPIYQKYKTLAADLKVRKESLGMQPGIESETIADKADSGLYDNVGVGKTSGAYASLATALQDANSKDAATLNAQKAETASNKNTGMLMAGAGIVGGIAGNILINENIKNGKNILGQTVAKESSDKINAKYDSMMSNFEQNIASVTPEVTACPSGATGTNSPDCTCTNGTSIYNSNSNSCDECTGSRIVGSDNTCVCPTDKPVWQNNTCNTMPVGNTAQCEQSENIIIKFDGSCTCDNMFDYNESSKKCECTAPKEIDENGVCGEKKLTVVEKIVQAPAQSPTIITEQKTVVVSKKSLSNNKTFATGKSELLPDAKIAIQNFVKAFKESNTNNPEYCVIVEGYTDRTGSAKLNQSLSEKRAQAVKSELSNNGLDTSHIISTGYGESKCGGKDNVKNDTCRKVDFTISPDSCPG